MTQAIGCKADGLQLVDGCWTGGSRTSADLDPGSGELLGTLTRGDARDVDLAVAAAEAASEQWRRTPPDSRARIIHDAAATLEGELEEWATLATREMGKPVRETRVECARAIKILRFFASEAWRPFGEQYASEQPTSWVFTRREPIGVVAVITPWNFPVAIPAWKLAPALIFGNTVVFKPADAAALSALTLVRALVDAGLPAGVLNVLLGEGLEVGRALAEHPGVRAISFTGSEAVGRSIHRAGAATGKAVQLELGGHNAVFIRADADIAKAAVAVAAGAFASAGQKCTATRRVYVADRLYAELLDRLVSIAGSLTVGYGLDESIDVGPLVSEQAVSDVLAAVAQAANDGRLAIGGERLTDGVLARGAYMSPAVLTDLPHDAYFAQNEVFGPAVGVWPVSSDEAALELVNGTRYGLTAAVFTRDLNAAKAFVEQLRVGIVHVNSQTAGAEVHVPFGGIAASGHGPHEQGRAAIDFYTQEKTVYLDSAG